MSVIKRPGFWLILVSLILVTVPHYWETAYQPSFVTDFLFNVGISRHAFERILYLAPIIWAGFLFRWRGVSGTSLAALACMLPQAVFISDHPGESVFQVMVVLVVGSAVALGFVSLRKQRDEYRAALMKLEEAHRLLQHYSQIARSNEKRLGTLNAISGVLAQSLELGKVLRKAIHLVMELMEVEITLIYCLDEGSNELVLVAYEGVSEEFARAVEREKTGEGFNGRVARTGQPMVVKDISADPRMSRPEVAGMRIQTELIVPLAFQGQARGTLCVAMRRPREFGAMEIDLLSAVASQISAAIENAGLYEKERLAMQKLAVSERNYRGLFENANDAIWVYDLEGRITVANRAFERLSGYAIEELAGMNIQRLLSDEGRILAGEVRRKLFQSEPAGQPYEQRIIKKDGREAVLKVTTSLVMEDGKPAGFQNIARDVTEEKRMQEDVSLYLSQVTKAREDERREMADRLHSDIGQLVHSLSARLDSHIPDGTDMVGADRASLEDLRQQFHYALEKVQRFGDDFRAAKADNLVLLPAVRWVLGEMDRLYGIKGTLSVRGVERYLPAEAELLLFRTAREALRKIEAEGQASEVEVSIEFGEGVTRISVRDDGKRSGLERWLEEPQSVERLGLAEVEKLVRLIGGNLEIRHDVDGGTAVVVEAPV
ncbi:MAG: hypothetical protein A2Y72_01930 [Chloroflexi bacterium RBG_13_53_26]|nr:MAG: hypothetical protein A2Y72_01930 [Chloroflexi bacterium RBG_13_53_26]